MTRRPHIAIATVAAGGGHVATARAMAEAIERQAPGSFQLTVHDLVLELGFGADDRRHKRTWQWMLAHPWSARALQRVADVVPTSTNLLLRWSLDAAARAAARRFAQAPPRLMVANHPFTSVLLTSARTAYGLDAPVLTFATEPFDASALWAEPRAERVVTPSRPARDDLVRMRVPPDVVDVVGYPVRQAFLAPPGKDAARAGLGLAQRFTCLVSFGGEGIARDAMATIDALSAPPRPPQVVVVAGRNAALAAALTARGDPNLRVLGSVDDMATLLAAADVVVGKAGPATVMEALAVGRPVLVTGCAGINELKVLRFLLERGLGHDVRGAGELRAQVERYRSDGDLGDRVARIARTLDFAGMTERLARYLVAAATSGLQGVRTDGPGLA